MILYCMQIRNERIQTIKNVIVPQDSIVIVIDTIHLIQKTAIFYSKQKKHLIIIIIINRMKK